jgi:hypothetical protein
MRDAHPHYDVLAEVSRAAVKREVELKDVKRLQERWAAWEPATDPEGPNRAVINKQLRAAEKSLTAAVSAFQAAVTAAVIAGASGTDIRRALQGILPVHWNAAGDPDEAWVGDL